MLTLYLTCLTCFLIPTCIILTLEIYKIIYKYHEISKKRYKTIVINNNDILNLAEIYIRQKKWLSCILLIESYNEKNQDNNYTCYNCIGFCYYQLQIYELAKYNYSKALENNQQDINSLFTLAELYKITKNINKAIKTYKKILVIDKNNKKAQRKLEKLIKI